MSINALAEMHNDFLIYAKEVNNNRSFPDVRDGLKPSQRAALYTMYRKGFSSNKPHVKSAKITGAVIGELWPHGDVGVYEAIVRMSQPWVNNIPEIDWHGANGSLLGGPQAASSRYTECRLSSASEQGFFYNIKKNTVDMIPNFSEDDEWPIAFPAIFPRLFINGSQGIGYTIAQEWEPGNLNEFVIKVKQYIKEKKVTYDNIYPDYPTAGIIVNKKDISSIYKTGKGTVILRGRTEIENNVIKITSLPYQVYVEPFITSIKELVNSNKLTGIEDVCNKSDDSGMLIEIECSGNPNVVLNSLYKLTNLQCSFNANQMALVNGKPELLTLEDYLKFYLKHNLECIKKEYQFDLDKARSRKEVVDGLLKALQIIDDVIKTIKKSKNTDGAREDLMSSFSFTKVQAQAIIDMKLGKLANLEQVELNKEANQLNKTIRDCSKMVSSAKEQEKEFLKRLEDFTLKYGWGRRTEVIDIDLEKEKKENKKNKTDEQFIITFDSNQEIKRISLSEYRPPKNPSSVVNSIKVGSKDKFILVSNLGNLYKLQANKISWSTMKSSGVKVSDLLTLRDDEYIKSIYSGTENNPYLFIVTDLGNVKKLSTEEIFSITKSRGTSIIKLSDDEKLLDIYLVDDNSIIVIANSKPREYQLKVKDFKVKSRKSSGTRGIKLRNYSILYSSLLN